MGRRARKPWSRGTYNARMARGLRANVVMLVVVAIPMVAMLVLLVFLLDGYLLGLVQGLLLAGWLGVVHALVAASVGGWTQLAGAWGEDNTRDVLSSARRRGWIHDAVHGLALGDGDIDHLVVMRDGTYLVVDSKWHADASARTLGSVARSALKAQERAGSILRSKLVGHRDATTRAVAVMWGGGQSDLPEPQVVDGVLVIAGGQFKRWLRNRSIERTASREDLERVVQGLHRHLEKVDPEKHAKRGR